MSLGTLLSGTVTREGEERRVARAFAGLSAKPLSERVNCCGATRFRD